MELDRYELKTGRNLFTFEFVSEGKKGKIRKVIQFQRMDNPNLYNLAFGDINENGELDDMAISDNGDTEKILATVVLAVYAFVDQYPSAWIYATGSTRARTRLYKIGINKYFDLVEADFDIMGEYKSEWEWYEKGRNYDAFAIQRKIH